MAFDAGTTVWGDDLSGGEGWLYKKVLKEGVEKALPPAGAVAIVHCDMHDARPDS